MELLHLPSGMALEEALLVQMGQVILRITTGCDLLAQLTVDPWQAAGFDLLAHHCLPCILPCVALSQGRHPWAPRLPSPSSLGNRGHSMQGPSIPCGALAVGPQGHVVHFEALFKPAISWQLRWMPTPYVQGYRALASRRRSHPQVAPALLVHLKAMRGHLVAWGLGLQAGRLVSGQWSALARWATFPFSQLEMLAFSRAGG